MRVRVVVIGAGSWGTTIASLAARNADTTLWARRPEIAKEVDALHTNTPYLPGLALTSTLRSTADLEEAVVGADVAIMAVPAQWFRATLEDAAEYLRPWVPVISLVKGLEPETKLRMTEIVAELLPGHPSGVLTGPNLAKEVLAGDAAASVLSIGEPRVAEVLQRVISNDMFRTYWNPDVVGCEIAGAAKNVIAIASGMADGLGTGDNTRATVITRGLAELTRLGTALGGKPETFAGLAGMADLIATCISRQSRNRFVGEQLGRGRPLAEVLDDLGQVAEGVHSAASVLALARDHDVDMPVCAEVDAVVNHGRSPQDAYRGLLRRAPRR
jgi:glycerol-3-phosphate dehydrogenase (NAD(P)+)